MIRKIDTNWKICDAFIWRGEYLHPIQDFNTFDLRDLIGIDEQKEMLLKNTESFLNNNGGLNVLLYGPRGCGKSTLAQLALCCYRYKLPGETLHNMKNYYNLGNFFIKSNLDPEPYTSDAYLKYSYAIYKNVHQIQ